MLTANLWDPAGLVNEAVGTVVAICYKESNGSPPSFHKVVTVRFDSFTGPSLCMHQYPRWTGLILLLADH